MKKFDYERGEIEKVISGVIYEFKASALCFFVIFVFKLFIYSLLIYDNVSTKDWANKIFERVGVMKWVNISKMGKERRQKLILGRQVFILNAVLEN